MSRGRRGLARRNQSRARRLPPGLLAALDADERAAVEWLMPDALAAQLRGLAVEDARSEIQGFMDGMARRGYDMADLAEVLKDE